jgi:hypothetical protein
MIDCCICSLVVLVKREEKQLAIVKTSNAICPIVWDHIVSYFSFPFIKVVLFNIGNIADNLFSRSQLSIWIYGRYDSLKTKQNMWMLIK